ncbi:unnamed protein product [Heligmosomoides polygyrus]|uniref:Uncharacterized protein n=1 Tax=Heligmosomoides polygyrus TaxID=6339 RepID=A0A183FCW3_HELPZ|nr:unnamed protein product [Heligmosomoides polygyrus]
MFDFSRGMPLILERLGMCEGVDLILFEVNFRQNQIDCSIVLTGFFSWNGFVPGAAGHAWGADCFVPGAAGHAWGADLILFEV